MTNAFRAWRAARVLFASAVLLAAVVWAVPAFGQETQPSPPARPQEQTPSRPATQPTTEPARPQPTAEPAAQPAPAAEGQPVAAPAAEPEPLFRDFKGVTLGMSAEEARGKLGTPQEKDKVQDFFVLSPTERARVYYDDKGRVSALIVTFVGKAANAPAAKAVLGSEIEANPDGSAYKLVTYPRAGYWVAYSRTAGDDPLTIITVQRAQTPNP